MRSTYLLLILGFSLVLASCQQGDEPQPAPLSKTDSLTLQLTGSWQSERISKNFYTNDILTDQQSSVSVETYNFTKEGDFHLLQELFSIKGKWNLNHTGTQLIVAAESGEVMQWKVQTLSNDRLVLYSSQTIMVDEVAQRLETWVECTRVIP